MARIIELGSAAASNTRQRVRAEKIPVCEITELTGSYSRIDRRRVTLGNEEGE
jgi:hypothetical protein